MQFPALHPLVVVGEPPTFVETRNEYQHRLAKAAFRVQWNYVHGRATEDELLPFTGLRVDRRLIEVDPYALEHWAMAGEFDLAEVYREMFS